MLQCHACPVPHVFLELVPQDGIIGFHAILKLGEPVARDFPSLGGRNSEPGAHEVVVGTVRHVPHCVTRRANSRLPVHPSVVQPVLKLHLCQEVHLVLHERTEVWGHEDAVHPRVHIYRGNRLHGLVHPEQEPRLRLAERRGAAKLLLSLVVQGLVSPLHGPISVWIDPPAIRPVANIAGVLGVSRLVHQLIRPWVSVLIVRSLHYPPPALVLARNDVDNRLVQSGQDVVDEGPILKDRHERLHGSFRE
mmetsp:Transcript_3090/g.10691  ORF Transcript_3090/g.10691 Transcript_3090/m.10691 type:complete len:249 (-) Transcript_3090:701-1447(-)